MFNKILIANRGEIACRVIKTAKAMGVLTVAVYSDSDKNALHVTQADEAVHIGGSASKDSYLRIDKVIQAALQTGVQAIHPGYGFLSENAEFARECAANNIAFIGPPISAIESMGSKSAAKNIMGAANVPLVPGYHGDDQSPEVLKQAADDMGYPVLLKAVAGGGGKGMRQVWQADEFLSELAQAKRESLASFGNNDMLIEKYLTAPRHIEVQVFCDTQGNAVYLFERDCSVQRRHQKVIEEAPAPNMPQSLREEMGRVAVLAARAIDYVGAGTVEFLHDSDGRYYFMEMNTRLQVEHPVTEMITGEDLVEWQFRVAFGEALPKTQQQLKMFGHAFEARIYAEDPNNDFMPTSGELSYLKPPTIDATIRVDTGVVQGDLVTPFYDPMIAKLVVWDQDRARALNKLAQALKNYQVQGITTNIDFLHRLATAQPFIDADLDTGFIEKNQQLLMQTAKTNSQDHNLHLAVTAVALTLINKQQAQAKNHHLTPWHIYNAWRMNQPNEHKHMIVVNGENLTLTATEQNTDIDQSSAFTVSINQCSFSIFASLVEQQLTLEVNGHKQTMSIAGDGENYRLFSTKGSLDFQIAKPDLGLAEADNANAAFQAPMNATVVEVVVEPGALVEKDNCLVILEAMKMQHSIFAPSAGTVTELFYQQGDLVEGGAELLAFEATSENE